MLQLIAELLSLIMCPNKKRPVPTKRVTISLIKVQSCTALLLMLLVRTSSYLKSVLRYTFLILDTYHTGTLYLREKGFEDPWLFFESKKGPGANGFGSTGLDYYQL